MARDERHGGGRVTAQHIGVLILCTLFIGAACWLAWTVFEAVFVFHP